MRSSFWRRSVGRHVWGAGIVVALPETKGRALSDEPPPVPTRTDRLGATRERRQRTLPV